MVLPLPSPFSLSFSLALFLSRQATLKLELVHFLVPKHYAQAMSKLMQVSMAQNSLAQVPKKKRLGLDDFLLGLLVGWPINNPMHEHAASLAMKDNLLGLVS